jgi:ABC-2 type transport system ATP-binding protein
MGLDDAAERLVRNYSGGMVRRLEIAQAMLHRPRVLFLDEPTLGLDPLARDAVWAHIQELRSEYQTTVLLTTHYMDEAESLCTRVGIMRRGRLVVVGFPQDLKASLGPGASMDDVFTHYTGETKEEEEKSGVTAARPTADHLG